MGIELLDMQPEQPSSQVMLTTAGPARALVRADQRRFLEPFMGHQLSVGQAAELLGESIETTWARVATLRRHGLVHLVGERRRAGRPIKVYAAPAAFTAPLDLLPVDDIEGLFALVDAPMRTLLFREMARAAGRSRIVAWGVRLAAADDHQARLDLCPLDRSWSPDDLLTHARPAVTFNWVPLRLDDAASKKLQRELAELVERYVDRAATSPTHLLGLFLTPVRDGTTV